MFIEADDSLPQLVSPQAIREGPQLPLHFWPWIHVGEQLPERQPVGHMEGSYRICCSEDAWMDLSLWLPKCLQSFSRCSLDPQVHHCYYWYHNNPQDYPSGRKTRQEILISTNLDLMLTNHSAFMLGSSLLCWESCCTASWWAAFTLWATHTVYCKGRRSILGNDCRQNCCLLSNPSCRGISGDTSTATPAWWEASMRCIRY